MANQTYHYTLAENKTVDGLVDSTIRFLQYQSMEVQTFGGDSYRVIQARTSSGELKQLVGMDKAIEIRIFTQNSSNNITVEIGNAKWADKAAVMAVSMFVLWPLAVTSGIGIYKQNQLFNQIRMSIEQYLFY